MHVATILWLNVAAAHVAATPSPQPRAVVELFTAQGCPACAAAEVAMKRLSERRDVIALTLPVTYWDDRGWADPLAQRAFTDRQRRFAAIGRREAATPQFVVDGRYATSETDPAALERVVEAARRQGGPVITMTGGQLTVAADARTARVATVWLADYQPGPVVTPIHAGLTRGRIAVQYNLVRRLTVVGRWTGAMRRLRLPPPIRGLRRAAFVQSADGGAIIGAAAIG